MQGVKSERKKRQPKKRTTTRTTRKKRVVTPPPMPLVLVDGRRLREEIKREYDQVVAELAKAREELDHFHQHDLPKFSRWVSSLFGALLTEIREASQKLHDNQLLLYEIEREVMYSGISHLGAYERVMNRREQAKNGRKEEEEEPRDAEETDFDFEEEDFHREADFESAEPTKARHPTMPEAAVARLKELYRAVVRRLHPDTQKEMTAQKTEWWHQAQAAYQTGDIEQLEVILSLCEIEEAGSSEKTNLSVLKRIIEQFRSSLRQIEHQITKSRRDPAWNFSHRRELEGLKREIGTHLHHDLAMIKEELRWIEEQLAVWSTQAQEFRSRPIYYRRRRSDPLGFF